MVKGIKIGLLAYSSKTGLGIQTREFYNHIPCEKVLIADISKLNKMPVDHSWCKIENKRVTNGLPSDDDVAWLVDGVDIIFLAETPLNYNLFAYANVRGVKTVLQHNVEFLDYFQKPDLPAPSLFASPSHWGIEKVKRLGIAPITYWGVPVNTDLIPYRDIKEVKTIMHIIGRPAAKDRNGTLIALDLFERLGKGFRYQVFLQRPKDVQAGGHFKDIEQRIKEVQKKVDLEVKEDLPNYKDIYKDGDLLVFPRRYGGLCLPLWEALSAGIPVVMTDISPNNAVLPKRWLAEANLKGSFMTRTEINLYEADSENLREKVQNVVRNFKGENLLARKIAENMSWKVQAPIYLERLKEICESSSIQKLLEKSAVFKPSSSI